jgi:hypothetical protein
MLAKFLPSRHEHRHFAHEQRGQGAAHTCVTDDDVHSGHPRRELLVSDVAPHRQGEPSCVGGPDLPQDVGVCHAGVGSALSALLVGKVPVLVPRRQKFGEHVDDHQVELAALLGDAGLAVVAEASDLTLADLERAAAMVVTRRDELPPLAI